MDHLYHGAAAAAAAGTGSFPGAFGVTTTRINANHYGSLDNNTSTSGPDLSASSLLGSTSRPTCHPHQNLPNQYAAAYAAAANFGIGAAAFLSCASGNGGSSNAGMDTYPLTTHLHQSPHNAYVAYDNQYPAYYQHYQPIQSPTQQGGYVLQTQQNSPVSVDDDQGSNALGHTARASPATLYWLSNNYEPCEGSSLPRCTLYNHYLKHCAQEHIEPVNAASFGKLIRSVFKGLKTRRLGTRGNSKYHYYGIRIKPTSSLIRDVSPDECRRMHTAHAIAPPRSTRRNPRHEQANEPNYMDRSEGSNLNESRTFSESPSLQSRKSNSVNYDSSLAPPSENEATPSSNGGNQPPVLGEGRIPSIPLPNLEELKSLLAPLGYSIQHVHKFIESYTANCVEMLENIKQLQLENIEEIWSNFWQSESDEMEGNENSIAQIPMNLQRLNQVHVFRLCTIPQIQRFVEYTDLAFYQVIIEILIPDVLSTGMTPSLTNLLRNFAKTLEPSMKKALHNAPGNISKTKLASVRLLAQTLKRYTSLNHLAQAARAVFQKEDQIRQMYEDFCRVDLSNVQEQAGWVCNTDPALIRSIQNGFRENLCHQKSLEQWAEWMEAVVDQVLAEYHDKPVTVQAKASKNFLLKWSFYSSMIIRDLTLRSAQSFGSFHLIRLLYDEYMLYLVEMRLAKAANHPALYVMSQNWIDQLEKNEVPNNDPSQLQPISSASDKPTSSTVPLSSVPMTSDHLSLGIDPNSGHFSTILHPHTVPIMMTQPLDSMTTGLHYVLGSTPKYIVTSMPNQMSSQSLAQMMMREPNAEEEEGDYVIVTDNTSPGHPRDQYVAVSSAAGHSQSMHHLQPHSQLNTIVYMEEEPVDVNNVMANNQTSDGNVEDYILIHSNAPHSNMPSTSIESGLPGQKTSPQSVNSPFQIQPGSQMAETRRRPSDDFILSGDILEPEVKTSPTQL